MRNWSVCGRQPAAAAGYDVHVAEVVNLYRGDASTGTDERAKAPPRSKIEKKIGECHKFRLACCELTRVEATIRSAKSIECMKLRLPAIFQVASVRSQLFH
jgi:hypothetical protein